MIKPKVRRNIDPGGQAISNRIFRKAALDRLASPERLDAPARLVGGPGWLILFTFTVAIAGGAIWAFLAEAPVSVAVEGILIDRAGLVEISAERGGRLDFIDLEPGSVVAAGAVVARMSQSDLLRALEAAEARLADARLRFTRFEGFYQDQKQREDQSDAARRATIERTLAVLRQRVGLLGERVEKTEALFEKNIVVQDRLLDAQIAEANARERVSVLEEEALRLDLGAVERESERRIGLLDEALNVEEQEREVARLSSQLGDQQEIRSARAGRVVELKVNAGDVVQPGDALATLAPLDGAGELEAVLYAPPGEGKRIEPGMQAEVSPGAVEREVYGFVRAEVASVSPLPATEEGMRRTLQNDRLVSQLSARGAPIEARVRLIRDAGTPTGLAWSSSVGPARGVGAGTVVTGRVIVDNVPVIDLLIPGLSRFLSRGGG